MSVFLCAPLCAAPKPLSKADITRLASKASLGSSSALKALIRERQRLLDLKDESPSLGLLTRVLKQLSPSKGLSVKIKPPKRIEAPEPENLPLKAVSEIGRTEHVCFLEADRFVFEGQKKSLADADWSPAGESMEMFVLSVKRRGQNGFEAETFSRILSSSQRTVMSQSLQTWNILPSGVWIKKGADSFLVSSLSETVQTPMGTFQDCLQVSGFMEKYYFDKKTGPVAMEIFDRRWELSGRTGSWTVDEVLTKGDRKALTAAVRDRAEFYGGVLEETVSLQPVRTYWAAPSAGTSGLPPLVVRSRSLIRLLNRRKEKLPEVNLVEDYWVRQEAEGGALWFPR